MPRPQLIKQKEIDTFIQDQDSPPFQYYLMREDKTDIKLTTTNTMCTNIVHVSAGHGFVTGTGQYISIFERGKWYQSEVITVTVNQLTLHKEVPYTFTTDAVVVRGVIDMNVDASGADQLFIFQMRQSNIPIDIQHAHVTIWNAAAAGDDGKFGDLGALTNGLRLAKKNYLNLPLGKYRTNSDFREYGAEVGYNDKSGGGGNYGVDVRFDIKKIYGIVIRVNPRTDDYIVCKISDKLDTLERLRVSIMGQYTVGE